MVYIVKAVIKGKEREYVFDDKLCAQTFATGIRSVGFPAIVVEKEVHHVQP